MPTSCEPCPPKTQWIQDASGFASKEVLGERSYFKFCPNTHLHERNRLIKVITYQRGSWGKIQKIGVLSYYCDKCGLRSYISTDD